jgi:hypothetical protein
VAVGQLEGCVFDFGHFAFGEQPESIDESQIRHEIILFLRRKKPLVWGEHSG